MEVVVPWRYSESVFDVELASSLYQDNAAGLVNSVCDAFTTCSPLRWEGVNNDNLIRISRVLGTWKKRN